jgi:hypothetical protein
MVPGYCDTWGYVMFYVRFWFWSVIWEETYHGLPQDRKSATAQRRPGLVILDFRLEEMSMNKRHGMRGLVFSSDNLKSKTCPAFDKLRPRACRGEPSRRIENLKLVGLLAIALTFTFGGTAVDAQQTGKVARIGYLDNSTASGAVLLDAFRQELSKLGWIEGKNITIEYRFAEQKLERLPELAAELVRLKVDLIVATGGPTPLAAKKATNTTPHRDGELSGPCSCGSGCQSGVAGRQYHWSLRFRAGAK